MSRFVLDASVTFAWCFADEASPAADALLERADREGVVVPGIWALEVANVLLAAERRRRITTAPADRFVTLLAALPITVDRETADRALGDTIDLARQLKLTAYDVAYLELARRLRLPLATRDADLQRAARATSVRLLAA
ncbi:MAG: type II toxin-antitoxin system VapC family toxin [Alphaproteobacteria bacterium]|nr:type II toxin-antitoxin system VapC family toxin [Alphaproteobacteria bacterium]